MDIKTLLQSMTLEEKLGQMTQLPPHYFIALTEAEVYGEQRDLGLSKEHIVLSGSILGIGNTEEMIKVQSYILKHSRLKIPALFMADIIHGYQTIFPIPLAQAASFNPEIVKQVNHISALEASTSGIHVTFSPMVDVSRDPRWGRVMEGYGEDPHLNEVMAQKAVEGYHTGKPTDVGYLATCFKHFAGYGASEAGRDYNTVDMSYERFYNIYAPSYQAAIDCGSELAMLAFNTFNGIPSTINQVLTKKILRDQMGFQGVIISDYDALHQTIAHGAAKDDHDAARLGMKAGLDIEMGSNTYIHHGSKLYEEGLIDMETIDASVLKILQLKQSLGLFDDPFKGADPLKRDAIVKSKEHFDLSQSLSYESPVLLKNQNVLPLSKTSKVMLVGPFAETKDMLGAWHWHGNSNDNTLYVDAFLKLGVTITHVEPTVDISRILPLLSEVDTVIIMCGESQHESGEAKSKVNIHLDPELQHVIHVIQEHNKKVISVIHGGRPLVLESILASDAILFTWFLGSRHTEVVSNILFGHVNPSGKLPMSIPRHVGQLPFSYHDFNTGRPYDPVHHEYVTKYLDVHLSPQFEFGFGLSYATFECDVSFPYHHWDGKNALIIKATLRNTSSIAGYETLLVYGTIHPSMPVRPLKKLIAFKKVWVEALKHVDITFDITSSSFILYDEHHTPHLDAGRMTIYLGTNPYELKRFDLDWRPS